MNQDGLQRRTLTQLLRGWWGKSTASWLQFKQCTLKLVKYQIEINRIIIFFPQWLVAETVKLLKWVQICSLEILFFPGRKILHMLQSSTISNLLIFLIWKLLNSDSSIKKMRQTGVLENIITKYSLEKAEVSIWKCFVFNYILHVVRVALTMDWMQWVWKMCLEYFWFLIRFILPLSSSLVQCPALVPEFQAIKTAACQNFVV